MTEIVPKVPAPKRHLRFPEIPRPPIYDLDIIGGPRNTDETNRDPLLDNNSIQYVGYHRIIVMILLVSFSLFNPVWVARFKSLHKLIKRKVKGVGGEK